MLGGTRELLERLGITEEPSPIAAGAGLFDDAPPPGSAKGAPEVAEAGDLLFDEPPSWTRGAEPTEAGGFLFDDPPGCSARAPQGQSTAHKTLDDFREEDEKNWDGDVPMLAATRALLDGGAAAADAAQAPVDEPGDVTRLRSRVAVLGPRDMYPDLDFDNLALSRACDGKNWALARTVAHRILRSVEQHRAMPPPDLERKRELVRRHFSVAPDDARLFESSLRNGDFTFAEIIADQIKQLAEPPPPSPPPPESTGPELVDV